MTLFTVRAHLRNIFIKVGVSRQVALVRVVLTADETREDD
jgi:DNA-binding CsgD family transcriptional regulator